MTVQNARIEWVKEILGLNRGFQGFYMEDMEYEAGLARRLNMKLLKVYRLLINNIRKI